MCRLLAYASSEPSTLQSVVGSTLNNFVELSKEHKHGWGLTTCATIAGVQERQRDLTPAFQSQLFSEVAEHVTSDGALLHLRLASKGLAIDISNNHPFIHGDISNPSHEFPIPVGIPAPFRHLRRHDELSAA